MSTIETEVQPPIASGVAAYVCAHAALFALVGMLKLPMPALWWSMLALLPTYALMGWLERRGRNQLATLFGIHASALAGGVFGVNARELFCLVAALF